MNNPVHVAKPDVVISGCNCNLNYFHSMRHCFNCCSFIRKIDSPQREYLRCAYEVGVFQVTVHFAYSRSRFISIANEKVPF